jgi:hypothetical protein
VSTDASKATEDATSSCAPPPTWSSSMKPTPAPPTPAAEGPATSATPCSVVSPTVGATLYPRHSFRGRMEMDIPRKCCGA